MHKLYLLFLLSLPVTILTSQTVTVSQDINLRSDFAFHIIGEIDESILLLRDQSSEKKVMIYDQDLVLQSERQVNLQEKRSILYEVISLDTAFCVIYGYRQEDKVILQMDIFSATAELKDSIPMHVEEKSYQALKYETIVSENESKIAFYNIMDRHKMKMIIYDISSRQLLLSSEYIINNVSLFEDIRQMELTDDGDFLLLVEQNNSKANKADHTLSLFRIINETGNAQEIIIPLNDIISNDVRMSIDNQNGRVGVMGLYDEKRSNESSGYFWVAGPLSSWRDEIIQLHEYNPTIAFELYGDQKKKRLDNFTISDILWKYDGTPIAILEMETTVSRQSAASFNNRNYNDFNRSYSGWSDHYNEDIVVLSLDENANEEWHQVFYKKQYSQNDQAIYSSFFPFKTPSRIRLIYNDEIKTNSTVSEYIFDGAGNFKRSSVLSTEYQNLRLRFKDALQISNSELLIPSQKSYVLNLVKIDYAP